MKVSRGGRPGHPVPNSPYVVRRCGRKAIFEEGVSVCKRLCSRARSPCILQSP